MEYDWPQCKLLRDRTYQHTDQRIYFEYTLYSVDIHYSKHTLGDIQRMDCQHNQRYRNKHLHYIQHLHRMDLVGIYLSLSAHLLNRSKVRFTV